MITLPNGIKIPDGDDTLDPEAMLGEIATSFSDAIGGLGIGKRQPRTFRVADQTEKAGLAALTTPTTGDRVFVEDTAWWEIYLSGAWKVWLTTKPVSWPIAHTGLTPGNGSSALSYSVCGDLVSLTGVFVWGSSSSWTTSTGRLILPFAIATQGTTSTRHYMLGDASYSNGATVFRQGLVLADPAVSASAASINFQPDSGVTLSPVSSTSPTSGAWASGAVLGLNLKWRRAI